MNEIVEVMKPTPAYTIYNGGEWSPGVVVFHSSGEPTLTRAILSMHNSEAVFTTDASGKVVLAQNSGIKPIVSEYTTVLEPLKFSHFESGEPAVKLYSLALIIIQKVNKGYGSIEYNELLLREATKEDFEDIIERLENRSTDQV